VLSEAGEDIIYIDRVKKLAINREVYTDEVLADLGLHKGELEEVKSIEVGNIFPLGTRFPEAVGLTYKDKDGKSQYPVMGSYGIGLGRVLGTIVEVLADERGMVWPNAVAPFAVHLISLGDEVNKVASMLYDKLSQAGVEVFYDDRDVRAGVKFSDADLIGIPQQVVISSKTIEKGDMVEVKERATGEGQSVGMSELVNLLAT